MNTPINRNRPANTTTTRSNATAPTNATVTPAKPGATAPTGNTGDGVDTDVHNASHDMRYRVGVNAVTSGSTTTAVPSLLQDWKTSLYEAAAEGLAHEEVIAPVLSKALAQAETDKGDTLSRGEKRQVRHDVETSLKKEFKTAFTAHHKDLTKSTSTKQKTERDVLLEERPRVSQLKDPFTAVIQDAPGAPCFRGPRR